MLTEFLGLEKRGSIENPSTPLSEATTLMESSMTDTGEPLGAERALRYAPVWQAVSMISGDLARMPLLPFDMTGTNKSLDKQHQSYRLVRRRGNRERTAFQVWRTFFVHCLLWNNGYIYIDRAVDGTPLELINLLPDRTSQYRQGGRLWYITEVQYPGEDSPRLEWLLPDEVLHVPGLAIDPSDPPELVQKARNSWALGLAAEGFSSDFFKNGTRTGGYLMIPSHFTEKAAGNLEEQFKKHTGRGHMFGTAILREGAKFEKSQFSPEEMQAIELRTEQVRDVARWFNLAPSRLGLSDSVAYNSKREDNQDYLDTTLSSWMAATEAEATDKLTTPEEREADSHEFQYDNSELLRMSPKEQQEIDVAYNNAGIVMTNEIRKRLGHEPVDGGDQPKPQPGAAPPGEKPATEEAAKEDQSSNGDSQENEEPEPEETQETDTDQEERSKLHRVIYSLTSRARHKAKNSRAFVEWIDGGLVQFHKESRDLLGDDGVVSEFHLRANELLEKTAENELQQSIDKLCQEFEEKTL